MAVDERLIQYRSFLDGKIKEIIEFPDDKITHASHAQELETLQEAYTASRDKLYELFPELKP